MVYTRDYHTPEDVDNEKYCVQRSGAFVEQWMDEIPTCRADRGTPAGRIRFNRNRETQ